MVLKNIYRKYYQKYPILFFRKIFYTFFSNLFLKKNNRTKDTIDWQNSTNDRSHTNYELIKDHEYILIEAILKNINKSEKILDICCNQGRFIFELKRNGYLELYGFDIMKKAIDCLKENPDYDSNIIKVEQTLAQNYFNDKPNNFFDWAITYTATIELIHPEFNIFKILSKKIKKGLIFVLNENGHSYPRFYRFLLLYYGFKIIKINRINENNNFINLLICIKKKK